MDSIPTQLEALHEAVARAGSQSEFARICGIGQPAVWKMLQSAKRLTAEYVLKVEAATQVSRHYLRPDIYPLPVGMEWPAFEFNRGPLERTRTRRKPVARKGTTARQAAAATA